MNITTNGRAAGRDHHGQHRHYPLTVNDLSNLSILGSISVIGKISPNFDL
jgi:hypothetical protein